MRKITTEKELIAKAVEAGKARSGWVLYDNQIEMDSTFLKTMRKNAGNDPLLIKCFVHPRKKVASSVFYNEVSY